MIPLFHLLAFLLDAVAVAGGAWLIVRSLAGDLSGLLEQTLAWGLASLLVVGGAGVLLGATGGLGQPGFLMVHVGLLAGFVTGRKMHRSSDWLAMRQLMQGWGKIIRAPGADAWLARLLLILAVGLMGSAFATNPVVYDALTYRLSRVGHWLQEGRIGNIPTDDARLNYMPVVPDLVMAWLLTMSSGGYKAAAVAQALGGMLALGATVGLARLTGLGRCGALGAACLLLGLPNVAPQFTSAYTDLFVTGVLAAAFYLWLSAMRRGNGSWLGGAGAGLALGAKGTVVYFAPGLLLAVVWLAWRHRASRTVWFQTILGAVLSGLIFVLPVLARNYQDYGGLLGPEEFVVWHHGKMPSLRGSEEKIRLNLASAFAQLCEPNSQPPWWRPAVQAVGVAVVRHLPAQDPYAFDDLNRRANLEKIYALAAPDADVASTGMLLPSLALLAGIAAWRRRKTADGATALIWAVAVTAFVLFMHWRVQWNPYLFRFLVIVTPWLVVLAAWGLEQLPRLPRVAAWTVVAATSVHGFGAAMLDTYQSGWPAVVRPAQSVGFHLYQHWRDWSAGLDLPAEPLRPALPMNLPLAAFYRQPTLRPVAPRHLSALTTGRAEDVAGLENGWLIVPAAKYIGREGAVMGRTCLYEGDEQHAFSLAAYRALRDGENPAALLYRNRLISLPTGLRRELLVRAWGTKPVRLELANPGGAPVQFTLQAPRGGTTAELAPGARLLMEILLPDDRASLITVDFSQPVSGVGEPAMVEARLAQ